MGKVKLALLALPIVAIIVVLVVFWKDICLGVSRVGMTIVLVGAAFIVGWALGFVNARRRYK